MFLLPQFAQSLLTTTNSSNLDDLFPSLSSAEWDAIMEAERRELDEMEAPYMPEVYWALEIAQFHLIVIALPTDYVPYSL